MNGNDNGRLSPISPRVSYYDTASWVTSHSVHSVTWAGGCSLYKRIPVKSGIGLVDKEAQVL